MHRCQGMGVGCETWNLWYFTEKKKKKKKIIAKRA